MFSKNRIGTAARSGDHVQISCQAGYFVTRVKLEGSIAQNARFGAVTCLIACLWLRRVYGGSCKTLRLREGVKVSKLEEVSHEMLVLRLALVWC